ncbi:glycosyltransferase family 4 protein, partial [Aerosakkonemataceae cyanobacterium BLCC-F50]
LYITLSQFAREKFIEGGFPAEKIVVKPNFVDPDPGVGTGLGGYALFVGRLSQEKGLDTLLAAWEQLKNPMPLKIVGEGPLAGEVAKAAQKSPKIEWLGRKPMAEVHALMGEAMVLIFPSKWYETFGRVAVEAFAKGTPVIAANIGAIAELIEHGRTGLRFQPGNATDLATQVEWVLQHQQELLQMRQEARAEFEAKYTAEKNYRRLMEIYSLVQRTKKNSLNFYLIILIAVLPYLFNFLPSKSLLSGWRDNFVELSICEAETSFDQSDRRKV